LLIVIYEQKKGAVEDFIHVWRGFLMSENEKKKETDKEIIAELKKEKQLLAKQTRANLFLGVAVGILCIVSAYSFGLSSGGIPANLAGFKSSDEPMGDIIQALAALVGVLVAGYGIFVTNDIAGKNTRIENLEKTLLQKDDKIQKQKDYLEVYKWMESAVVEHKIQNRDLKVDDEFHNNSKVYGTQKNNLQNYVRKYADDYDLQFPRNPKRR